MESKNFTRTINRIVANTPPQSKLYLVGWIFLFLMPLNYLHAQQCNFVQGEVTGFSWSLTPCQDPYTDLDIINAEVSVTGEFDRCRHFTDIDGEYTCEVCPASDSIEICVETICDAYCGDTTDWNSSEDTITVVPAVTAADIVQIQKFISGADVPSKGQFLAADANGDGILDEDDLDCIREEIPGCPDSWCRFIPKSEVDDISINFDGSLHNPNNHDLNNCIKLSAEDTIEGVDFYRFNIGDVVSPFCSDCVHGEWGQYPRLSDPSPNKVTTKFQETEHLKDKDPEFNIKGEKNYTKRIRLNHYAPVDIPASSREVITQFYELGGQLIMENKYSLVKGNNTFKTDTHHLPTGIYIIKYITETDVQSQKVLIK